MIEVYADPCFYLLGCFIAIWIVIAYFVDKRERERNKHSEHK